MSEAMMVIKSRAQIEPIQGRKTASGDPMRLRAAMLERRQSTAHEHDLMRERGMSAAAEARRPPVRHLQGLGTVPRDGEVVGL